MGGCSTIGRVFALASKIYRIFSSNGLATPEDEIHAGATRCSHLRLVVWLGYPHHPILKTQSVARDHIALDVVDVSGAAR